MARLEAEALAGYWPFPNTLIRDIASLISSEKARKGQKQYGYMTYGTYLFLDPCAGEGEALIELGKQLLGPQINFSHHEPTLLFNAIEMEQLRYEALKSNVRSVDNNYNTSRHNLIHADAFTVRFEKDLHNRGADVLWLNPPYGLDDIHGRLESKFLERFTDALVAGTGLLVLIIPFHALSSCAKHIAQNYDQVNVWRVSEPYFSEEFAGKQIVLIGRRRERAALMYNQAVLDRLNAISADPTLAMELPKAGATLPLYELSGGVDRCIGFSRFEAVPLDVNDMVSQTRPWMAGGKTKKAKKRVSAQASSKAKKRTVLYSPVKESGLHLGIKDFVGRPFNVLMPPKMAHIALALAAGIFNGQEVLPDDTSTGLPPLVIRGTFEREYVTVEEKKNSKGQIKSEIQVQQPVLTVSVRDMNTMQSYELQPGAEPTGAYTLDTMNVADLIVHYGQALVALMLKQFPPLHDPFNQEHQIVLPPLGRKPYASQYQIIQAGVKQLYLIGDVLVLGEVGTGKSHMALSMVGALSREHYQDTIRELARIGLDAEKNSITLKTKKIGPIEKVMVLCPPHLLKSWKDQIGYTLPGARSIVIDGIPDLDQPTARDLVEFNQSVPGSLAAIKDFEALKKASADYRQKAGLPGYGMTFYILSRETAKLGYDIAPGVERYDKTDTNLCPRCGASILEEVDRIKRLHMTCNRAETVGHGFLSTDNPVGRLAQQLADVIARIAPENEVIKILCNGRYMRKLLQKYADQLTTTVGSSKKKQETDSGQLGKLEEGAVLAQVQDYLWKVRREELRTRAVIVGQSKGYGDASVYYGKMEYGIVERLIRRIEKALRGTLVAGTHNSSVCSDNPLFIALKALTDLMLSLDLESEVFYEVARRLFSYSWNLEVTLKDKEGNKTKTVVTARSNYGTGQSVRNTAMELLLLADRPGDKRQLAVIEELKSISKENWHYFEQALNRLKEDYGYYTQVASGRLTYEQALMRSKQRPYSYGWNVFAVNLQTGNVDYQDKKRGSFELVLSALTGLYSIGGFKTAPVCTEYLWSAAPLSRNYDSRYAANEPGNSNPTKNGKARHSSNRYPVARYISRFKPDMFDLLIADELHEYNQAAAGSAQGIAFHRLAQLNKPIIGATGSLMGGYASSLFSASQALFQSFREEFPRDSRSDFILRYGFLKKEVLKGREEEGIVTGYGSRSERREVSEDREVTKGEAPGVLPLFTIEYLLKYAIFIHKEDLDEALPTLGEYQVPIVPAASDQYGRLLMSNFQTLQQKVLAEIRQGLFNGKAAKLWGALAELLSALDLCHEETGNCEIVGEDGKKYRAYQVRYPDELDEETGKLVKGELVADMPLLPNSVITPKERWLIEKITEELAKDRPVMVYLRHTGKGGNLTNRLKRIIKENVPGLKDEKGGDGQKIEKVISLDSAKVATSVREQWINDEVITKGVKVMLVNAVTVQTGLNNLVYFPTVIWFESTYNAYVYRQANGRVHRIGQCQPVDIFATFYKNTTQELAINLLAQKVTASLQVDGLSVEGALQAAGAAATDGGEYLNKTNAANIGKAIFEMLQKRGEVPALKAS
jgi:hypothetical protein